MHPRSLALALVAALLAACASAGSHTSASRSSAAGREVFTVEQLASTAAATVYDALNTLEPELLTGRGRGAPDVYVGAVKQSDGIAHLKQVSLSGVREVVYLRYDQAQRLPNERSSGGAFVVTLR